MQTKTSPRKQMARSKNVNASHKFTSQLEIFWKSESFCAILDYTMPLVDYYHQKSPDKDIRRGEKERPHGTSHDPSSFDHTRPASYRKEAATRKKRGKTTTTTKKKNTPQGSSTASQSTSAAACTTRRSILRARGDGDAMPRDALLVITGHLITQRG